MPWVTVPILKHDPCLCLNTIRPEATEAGHFFQVMTLLSLLLLLSLAISPSNLPQRVRLWPGTDQRIGGYPFECAPTRVSS